MSSVTDTLVAPPPGSGPPPPGPPPSRPRKRRNRVLGAVGVVVAILFVAYGCWVLVDVLGHTSSTVVRTLPAVHEVRIDMGGTGKVEIVAEDRPDTQVTRRLYQGLRRTRVRETVAGGVLTLHTRCPSAMNTICHATYVVRVPLGTSVVGRNDGGSILLTGVTGADVRSDGGRVALDHVGGTIDVSTDGGHVTGEALDSRSVTAHADGGRVVLAFATQPDHVDARSDGGRVEVVIPPGGTAYRVDAQADGGQVDDRIATDQRVTDRTITARSDGGAVTLRYVGG